MTIVLSSFGKLNGQVIHLITEDGMPVSRTVIKHDSNSSLQPYGVFTTEYISVSKLGQTYS